MAKRNLSKARGRRKWTEAEARQVLAALDGSGEPLARFARKRGLNEQRLYWWKQRLASGKRSSKGETSALVELAPVVVTGGNVAAAIVRFGGIEIEVMDPERIGGGWMRDLAEALGVSS
jgi:transposase-like protein